MNDTLAACFGLSGQVTCDDAGVNGYIQDAKGNFEEIAGAVEMNAEGTMVTFLAPDDDGVGALVGGTKVIFAARLKQGQVAYVADKARPRTKRSSDARSIRLGP